MRMKEAMIAWGRYADDGYTRTRDGQQVEVGPWPDLTGWSFRYQNTTGFCYMDRHRMKLDAQLAMIFIDFNSLVVGYGIDPQEAHREFLKIDEYRKMIPEDFPGADPDGGYEACLALQD